MRNIENLLFILTSLEAIEKIDIYTANFKTPQEFLTANQQLNYNASLYLMLVIGEETKKIESDLKNNATEIKWKLIAGFRNRLAHDYRGIDPFIPFEIINKFLPPLKIELIKMVEQYNMPKAILSSIIDEPHYAHLFYLLKDK